MAANFSNMLNSSLLYLKNTYKNSSHVEKAYTDLSVKLNADKPYNSVLDLVFYALKFLIF